MSRKLKVLHVTPSFYPALIYGGPTHSVFALCRSLIGQGCQVRVLTTDANGPNSVLNVSNDNDVEVCSGLLVRYCHRIMDVSVSPTFLRLLIQQIRWADLVHLMSVYSFPTIPTLLVCKLLGKPVVWSPRGMLQRWEGTKRQRLKAIWERICRASAPRGLILHTTSVEEAHESSQRLPGIETVVIPNGVEIPTSIPDRRSHKGLRIVYLGRLHPKKGIENLLSAYRMMYSSLGMTSSMVIAGAGEDHFTEQIRIRIQELGLAEVVKMIGEVSGGAKERLFENADVIVVPSHTENFGLVVAEALAHGVPVIASRGTPWRRVEEVGCGLWVNNDPSSLAAALERISMMPLGDMGLRGRQWMEKEFSWNFLSEQMMHVYQKLAPNR